MGIFEHFPYTNFHELNLDWLLNAVKKLDKKVEALTAAADPVVINITAGNTEAGTPKEITDVKCNISPAELYNIVTAGTKPVVGSVNISVDGVTMATTNVSYMTGITRTTTLILAVFVKNPGANAVTYTVEISISNGGNIASILQEV